MLISPFIITVCKYTWAVIGSGFLISYHTDHLFEQQLNELRWLKYPRKRTIPSGIYAKIYDKVSHKSFSKQSITRLINLLGLMRDPMKTGDTGMIGSHVLLMKYWTAHYKTNDNMCIENMLQNLSRAKYLHATYSAIRQLNGRRQDFTIIHQYSNDLNTGCWYTCNILDKHMLLINIYMHI